MVDITQIDHVEAGLELLPSQWEGKPILRGILAAWLTPLNETEQCIIDTRDGFNIRTAVGNQLDIIGDYFDERRKGRTDTEYRNAILAIIAANNGSGTPFQLSDLFSTLTNTTNINLFEHYPLSIFMVSTLGDVADVKVTSYMDDASAAAIEYGGLAYDPDGFAWVGNDTAAKDANLFTQDDDQIVDNIPNNIVVVANFEQIDDGTHRSSFIDLSVDGTSIGYGENYGESYGGKIAEQSQFVDAVIKNNTQSLTTGLGAFIPWATMDEFDPITGTANKVKPIRQIQDSGLKRKQPMARQFFNWMMANIDSWFTHLGDRTIVGTNRISTLPLKFVTVDTVLNNQLYRITIDGENADFTSDSDATLDEITAGLALALDNLAFPTNGVDNGDGTITIERDALYEVVTTVNANMTITEDFPTRFGGTWAFNGSELFGTTNEKTYVFERTS